MSMATFMTNLTRSMPSPTHRGWIRGDMPSSIATFVTSTAIRMISSTGRTSTSIGWTNGAGAIKTVATTVAAANRISLTFSERLLAPMSGGDVLMTGHPGKPHHPPIKIAGFRPLVGPDGKEAAAGGRGAARSGHLSGGMACGSRRHPPRRRSVRVPGALNDEPRAMLIAVRVAP